MVRLRLWRREDGERRAGLGLKYAFRSVSSLTLIRHRETQALLQVSLTRPSPTSPELGGPLRMTPPLAFNEGVDPTLFRVAFGFPLDLRLVQSSFTEAQSDCVAD